MFQDCRQNPIDFSAKMHFSTIVSLAFAATAQAVPALIHGDINVQRGTKPAAFFLAGDSTTDTDGGWGNGFLTTLKNGAIGTNFGHSGATTASFVADKDWANVIKAVKANAAKYSPYVTIQVRSLDFSQIPLLISISSGTMIRSQRRTSPSPSSRPTWPILSRMSEQQEGHRSWSLP